MYYTHTLHFTIHLNKGVHMQPKQCPATIVDSQPLFTIRLPHGYSYVIQTHSQTSGGPPIGGMGA